MNDTVPAPFRAHFKRHNRRVLLLAFFTLLLALGFWALIYLAVYWVTLLTLTAWRGIDATMPGFFMEGFVASAVILCAIGYIAHRISPDESPKDKQTWWKIAFDLLLAIPRVTLTAWETLTAYRFLNERDLTAAWWLAEKVGREEKISMQSIPVEMPDPAQRRKVILSLQLAELIDVHRENRELVVTLHDKKARLLCQPHVRIHTRKGSEMPARSGGL